MFAGYKLTLRLALLHLFVNSLMREKTHTDSISDPDDRWIRRVADLEVKQQRKKQ